MTKGAIFGLAAIAALVLLASSYLIGGRYTLYFDSEAGVWARLDRLTGNVTLCAMVADEARLACVPATNEPGETSAKAPASK